AGSSERWHTPMSALGQKQTFREVETMSALPPKADIETQLRDVRFVPKADNIDDVVIIDGFPLPLAGGGLVVGRLQRHVLHSFALREPRERLLQDHPLEVRRLLVRLERGFVAEHLVEQEL